jgi:hypothetical protein
MQSTLKTLLTRSLFALAALCGASTAQTLKAAELQCQMQNAIMHGTYVTSGTGTITGVGPIASVGLVVYNGNGTGTLVSGTTTVNGAVSTASNVPASFTVNQDCTGTKTLGAAHFNFVISADGDTITWIVSDPAITMSGTAVRLRRDDR